MLRINGQDMDLAGQNLQQVLSQEGYQLDRVVVERNLEIVPKEQYADIILADGDSIEVLNFVGGG